MEHIMQDTAINNTEKFIKHGRDILYPIDGNVFKYKTWNNKDSKTSNIKLATEDFQGFGSFRTYGFQFSGDLRGHSSRGSYYNDTVENCIISNPRKHFKVMAYASLMDNAMSAYNVDKEYNNIDNYYIDKLIDFKVKKYYEYNSDDTIPNQSYKRVIKNQVFIENVLSVDFNETSIIMHYMDNSYDLSDALYLDDICFHHNILVLSAYAFSDLNQYINFCKYLIANYEYELYDNISEFNRSIESYITNYIS